MVQLISSNYPKNPFFNRVLVLTANYVVTYFTTFAPFKRLSAGGGVVIWNTLYDSTWNYTGLNRSSSTLTLTSLPYDIKELDKNWAL